MNTYLVTYGLQSDATDMTFHNQVEYFLCEAEDKDHAMEQVYNAYPDSVILMVYICTPA